jgi:hypothetical protein
MHTQKSFFFYYNTRFTGLLSSGSHNFIFYIIVFINNHIPLNSTLIFFHYFYLIFLFFSAANLTILPFSTSLVHPGRLASSTRQTVSFSGWCLGYLKISDRVIRIFKISSFKIDTRNYNGVYNNRNFRYSRTSRTIYRLCKNTYTILN